jgi:DNA polymerase-2
MNSFYGAVASPKSRLNNREVGEAITSFGRNIIQKAKLFIEEKGHKAIYGDTDSIFVKISKKFNNLDDKINTGKEIENELNDYFNNWVKDEYGQKNYLNIELEKIYSKFFIASKKRYTGYDEISKKLQFVGMEAIRGDWTELAKSFQVNLVNLIFSGADKKQIEEYINQYINKLKDGEYDDLLIYSKKNYKTS